MVKTLGNTWEMNMLNQLLIINRLMDYKQTSNNSAMLLSSRFIIKILYEKKNVLSTFT